MESVMYNLSHVSAEIFSYFGLWWFSGLQVRTISIFPPMISEQIYGCNWTYSWEVCAADSSWAAQTRRVFSIFFSCFGFTVLRVNLCIFTCIDRYNTVQFSIFSLVLRSTFFKFGESLPANVWAQCCFFRFFERNQCHNRLTKSYILNKKTPASHYENTTEARN